MLASAAYEFEFPTSLPRTERKFKFAALAGHRTVATPRRRVATHEGDRADLVGIAHRADEAGVIRTLGAPIAARPLRTRVVPGPARLCGRRRGCGAGAPPRRRNRRPDQLPA